METVTSSEGRIFIKITIAEIWSYLCSHIAYISHCCTVDTLSLHERKYA